MYNSHESLTKCHFRTRRDVQLLSAVATLHEYPVLLDMVVIDDVHTWKIRCTNPRPMRSLGALSEGIDRILIDDRNLTGASLEFGRFDVQLFVGEEMTDRFDCDTCDVEHVVP